MQPTRREAMLAAIGAVALNAGEVKSLMEKKKLSRSELMLKLLPQAKTHAHPPISNYFVGAVASGVSGNLYFGQNIEIDGNPLGLAVHAEQSAIANAYMAGEVGIDAIAVNAPPCGHCRQFLSEVSIDKPMQVLMPGTPAMKLADLLPHAFGPKNLGLKRGAFPVEKHHLSLRLETKDPLVQAALKAAGQAYAPYSKSPSGAALLTSTGRVFAGSYIENAAFNPSLPPLQAALAGYFAAGADAGAIERAVLVEGEKSAISQYATTKSTLAAFNATAKFERFVF